MKRRKTILMVDDEDCVIEPTCALLTRLNYRVLSASSGKDALDTFRKNHNSIDLVILDMIMPEMSGKDIYPELKAIDPDLKVLLFSGYHKNEQVQELINHGCNDFIQKPFSIKQLTVKIEQIFELCASGECLPKTQGI